MVQTRWFWWKDNDAPRGLLEPGRIPRGARELQDPNLVKCDSLTIIEHFGLKLPANVRSVFVLSDSWEGGEWHTALTQLFHVTLTTGTQGKMEGEVTAGGICVDSCTAEFMIMVSQMSKIVGCSLSQMYWSSLEAVFRAKCEAGLNVFWMDFHENVFMHNIHKSQRKNSPDFLFSLPVKYLNVYRMESHGGFLLLAIKMPGLATLAC